MAVEVEKQLTEYKLRFFTNISHEFRTPLTIIRGAIEDLAGQENIAPLIGKQLTLLTKSSTRLLRLIDQLLEFRRLQNNKMELKLEWTEAERFFYDIYQTFKEMAERKKIEFLFESNEYKRKMLLDRSKMDKIAYNLLSNAFKNTPTGGKIVMKLDFSTVNDTFILSVSDSGAGVPVEKRNMLFVRFEQIHYASDGTGVGLHLTSELAKVHKGNIVYTDSEMGDIMQELGTKMQVFAITHLPQIAAKGQAHYFVYKKDTKDRTLTRIKQLEGEERVNEVARMLSGASLTEASLANAKDLLGIKD